MSKTIILAIKYAEPEWQQTLACLLKQKEPLLIIDRNGTGSLAEAINRGVRQINRYEFDYVWVVTNITFQPDVLLKLKSLMHLGNFAAIHPSFNSDHQHIVRGNSTNGVNSDVPFLEFTAPLVRIELLNLFPLDENMPYWGHDLDWGYQIRNSNRGNLAVDYTTSIQHTYIRNNNFNHPVTLTRKKLRKATDQSTRDALVAKYGQDWAHLLKYPNDND